MRIRSLRSHKPVKIRSYLHRVADCNPDLYCMGDNSIILFGCGGRREVSLRSRHPDANASPGRHITPRGIRLQLRAGHVALAALPGSTPEGCSSVTGPDSLASLRATALRPHEGSSETSSTLPVSGRANPSRHKLQPHEGSSETRRCLTRQTRPRMLQPHGVFGPVEGMGKTYAKTNIVAMPGNRNPDKTVMFGTDKDVRGEIGLDRRRAKARWRCTASAGSTRSATRG